MQIFKAKKGNFRLYLVVSLLFPIYLYWVADFDNNLWWLLPSLLPFILFIWIYFSTKYAIINEEFYYQSAFIKGKIPIAKIKKIQKNKTLWAGVKPAMATKGLIIQYGFDEVYVAPENNEKLVEELMKINPDIVIES